ncbi:MAG: branched-chain amino acid transaminase, partial [Chloroflexi bacterium]|nr:branched-chain amino acid transaminase [Chloroflexota bacterium]
MPKYAFFKRNIVPLEQAKIGVMTHAFNYGTGVFEGIRAYWNEQHEQLYVFQLKPHYERFLNSCRVLMLDIGYTADELCDITLELLCRENHRTDTYIRPLAYKSSEGIGVRLHDLEADFTVFAVPYGKYIESDEACRVQTSSWRRVDDNAIPARAKITGAYVNSALAKTEAVLNGFDEAIVLTQDGHVSEGSAENFWMVKKDKAITPPVSDNILEGITRNVVRELLESEVGIEVVERSLDRTELYSADELFFCGTGVEIVAISEVDRRKVGEGCIGPIGKQLRSLYYDIVRGNNAKYARWCTPVYESAAPATMPKL